MSIDPSLKNKGALSRHRNVLSRAERIEQLVREFFDLTPYGIITALDLIKPIYTPLAAYGHMGREDLNVSWEKTDRADELRVAAGL